MGSEAMIRLIVADLDGTLLDSDKRLSPRLFPLIQTLRAHGVRFAPASGRQYYNLRELFAPIADETLFIAENGGMICDGGKTLFIDRIPPEELRAPLALVRSLPQTYAILSGEHTAYYEDDTDAVFLRQARMYYARMTKTDDLLQAAAQDDICKMAIFHHQTVEQDVYPQLREQCGERFLVALSGVDWVDLMNPWVNKGAALQKLQEWCAVTPAECMAFGDYLNDLEMMQACENSYAMANAHPALKAVSRYRAASNDEDGVVKAIYQALEL